MWIPLDRLYPIIALAALAGATLWLERVTRSDEPRSHAEARQFPDFIGEQVRMTRFDVTGQRRYELIADKVTHYPVGDVTEFEQPHLRYETADGQLRITAAWGETREGGETLDLVGDVEVFRDGIDGNVDMSLTSDTLTVWPDDERAATDDPVVLTHGATVATGNGMRADNLFGALQLIGNARVVMPRAPRN